MKKNNTPRAIIHRDDPMAAYNYSISHIQLITPEEEKELARRIQKGDRKALEKLVTANLRFVISIAKKYLNCGLDICDLISEGNIGLVRAAESFDGSKKVKFISYAVKFIRQQIMDALTSKSRIIRLPASQLHNWNLIIDFRNSYEMKEGNTPSIEDMAYALNMPEETVASLMHADNRSIVSLDNPVGEDGDNSLGDILNIEDDDSVVTLYGSESDMRRLLNLCLNTTLMERESYVIRHLYGIDCECLTLEQIALELGLSRERVRQISKEALRKMKESRFCNRLRMCC